MKIAKLTYLFLCLVPTLVCAQQKPAPSEAIFIENKGQWEGNFTHKLRINNGAFFFEKQGLSLLVLKPDEHAHEGEHRHLHEVPTESFTLKLQWLQADVPYISQENVLPHTQNYLLGNDKSKWRAQVPLSKGLRYNNLYPGIHLHYFGNGDQLEYDIEIDAHADPTQLAFQLSGQEAVQARGSELRIYTPYGVITESIPYAYQEINGQLYEVECTYQVNNGVIRFKLGNYDKGYPLIIDPVLEFSTLTGSPADNFGFTATYDDNGNMYSGGVALSPGYPTTPGVVQDVYGGGATDISITKFNPNGTQALFNTIIGGDDIDLPHSMVVGANGNLYILGNTGSADFPMGSNPYQATNNGLGTYNGFGWNFFHGSNIFVLAISPNGQNITGGTFLGGDSLDGANIFVMRNYGDMSRGEIITDQNNNVYITTSCLSDMVFNGQTETNKGGQDAVVASFNADLSVLRWGHILGGSDHEAGYSLKLDVNNKLFLAGSTFSNDLTLYDNAGLSFAQYKGGLDGYLYRVNALNGTIERGIYTGGSNTDQNFFVTLDRSNKVYTYGQSTSILPVTPGAYQNVNARQFISKFNNDLTAQELHTTVGSGPSNYNLVPTAFLVDDCYKIYISGWNGESNRISATGSALGNTRNLPITQDAYQSSTDGSDFYFMVLERDADSLIFASYFGGTGSEHVDGGTSRFDPKGIVYQAICAGCGGRTFPTTPGAYSEVNGSTNCNMGSVKFDFQATIRARGEVDYTTDVDTVCNTLFVDFTNTSINADVYEWFFGNGQTSNLREPRATYTAFGTYNVTLVAYDTTCGLVDTFNLSIVHDQGVLPKAAATVDYEDCDKSFEARFTNTSRGSSTYRWDFGDGSPISTQNNPVHNFPAIGTYTITLTAIDTICRNQDEMQFQVTFTDTIPPPTASAFPSACLDGSLELNITDGQPWYSYTWSDNLGRSFEGESPRIVFSQSGFYFVHLEVFDSICNATYTSSYPVRLSAIQNEVFIPNAFTPNGDNLNDVFEISGNKCTEYDHLTIYNRWGQIVFETDHPYTEFWDATINEGNTPANQEVYIYALKRGKELQRGTVTLIR
jgi:gliding motility-associated-like protein